ncbi:sporulation protein YpjB [Bacillus stercoris]|uniref:sporulation protein YpjB n=1 Tax=Bacillus TaxID=1386 RepID=UPI0002598724|nr:MULTISPECIES: sporulation protein YpjB [Bacillus]NLS87097.1 sporulation protein YpjB [Bacillus subtilis]AFI28790.1 YpjB [Bacillus sp. JS]MDN0190235.1 sporulation protein YpjB [Bacillus sp. B.PNR1]MDN3033719.1 sporulation protein YpjB [Bacillus sp. B.PNR2]QRZ91177.1 sporulation protein YpjB [Bacillus sp. LJBS06]
MKRKLTICLLIALIFYNGNAKAAERGSLEELNDLSDTVFQMTRQSKYEEALQVLGYFEKTLKSAEKKQQDSMLTGAQIRQITLGYNDMVRSLKQADTSDTQKLRAAAQFRMLMDAVDNRSDPLWGSLEKPIMEAFTELKRDVQKNEGTSFHEKWNEFISLYDLIYPSLTIDVSEEKLETVGKHIDVIEQGEFQQMTESTKLERLSLLQHDLKNLFDRAEEDDADPSLLWVMITTGSIIITALTYVGYRKYKAEKNKLKKRDYPK